MSRQKSHLKLEIRPARLGPLTGVEDDRRWNFSRVTFGQAIRIRQPAGARADDRSVGSGVYLGRSFALTAL